MVRFRGSEQGCLLADPSYTCMPAVLHFPACKRVQAHMYSCHIQPFFHPCCPSVLHHDPPPRFSAKLLLVLRRCCRMQALSALEDFLDTMPPPTSARPDPLSSARKEHAFSDALAPAAAAIEGSGAGAAGEPLARPGVPQERALVGAKREVNAGTADKQGPLYLPTSRGPKGVELAAVEVALAAEKAADPTSARAVVDLLLQVPPPLPLS